MVLPLLVAGAYGAGALAAGAAAAQIRRELAKLAAGPVGNPLLTEMKFRDSEVDLARHGNVLVVLKGRLGNSEDRSLFDFVLVTNQRIRFHNAHNEDEDFHETEDEMSVELSKLAGIDVKGGLAEEIEAFVYVHGFRVLLAVCPCWDRDDDFSIELSFESRNDRSAFLRSAHVARSYYNNGAEGTLAMVQRLSSVAESALDQDCLDEMSVPHGPEPEPEPELAIVEGVTLNGALRVVEAAKVRAEAALDSPQVGMLFEDELVRVIDVVTRDGRQRVRFARGWASIRASDGSLLLEPMLKGTGFVFEQELQQTGAQATALEGFLASSGAGSPTNRLAREMREESGSSSNCPPCDQPGRPLLELGGGPAEPVGDCSSDGANFDILNGLSPRSAAIIPRLDQPSKLLASSGTPAQTAALSTVWRALPNLVQVYDWQLEYRLSEHGASLSSLLRHAGHCAPALLIARVERAAGEVEPGAPNQFVVGALASRALVDHREQLGHEQGSGKWKGTGQSFIFGMAIESAGPEDGAAGNPMRAAGPMQCYNWTRECSCFQLCGAKEGLGFGGGGHGYGLWINNTAQQATSASCTTYGNPTSLLALGHKKAVEESDLKSPHRYDLTGTVIEIEIWSFRE